MSRMWGTTLDHVIEMQVVTADGVIRTVNETHESDLFWVCPLSPEPDLNHGFKLMLCSLLNCVLSSYLITPDPFPTFNHPQPLSFSLFVIFN